MRKGLIYLALLLLSSPAFATTKVQEVGPGVWLIEDHSLPIVTVKITFENSGSAYDPKGKEGLANFASQMLDEGAGDLDSLAFNRALDSHAIRLNAEASEDMFTVSMQTLSEFKGDALGLLTLAINKPRFDTETIERNRASIGSDLRQLEENPEYLASLKWKELAFPNHPYGHPRRGTPASIATITRADLQQFANLDFACHPKLIAVVGDITLDEVKKWIHASAPSVVCDQETPVIADITPPDGKAPVIVRESVPQTVVQIGLPGVKRNNPDYYAVYLLSNVMGGNSLISRLGKEIRNKRGLAYYVNMEPETLDHAGFISAHFATRNAKTQEAFDIFIMELQKVAKDGITPKELEDAKSYITGSFPLQIDNQNALAEYLIAIQHHTLGKNYIEKRNSLINAVTLSDVNRVARTLLSHTSLAVMVGDPETQSKP